TGPDLRPGLRAERGSRTRRARGDQEQLRLRRAEQLPRVPQVRIGSRAFAGWCRLRRQSDRLAEARTLEQLQVDLGPGKGMLEGRYEPDFAEVADEFVKNFRQRDEVGASVTLKHEGRTVVDLWGGMASRSAETPWERDTVCVVF